MSAIQYDTPDQDRHGDGADPLVPTGRVRRRFFNRKSAVLAAAVTCAAGFYGGVQVEKSQLSASTTAAAIPSAGPGSAGATAGASARAGFPSTGGAGGAGGRLPFAGRGGGGGSFGTVSSANGKTIYVTEASGNTVKVTLSSATKITKSQSASSNSLRPGDAVLIQGVTNKNGTIAAASVNDTGG
jgi:hypothetical protein